MFGRDEKIFWQTMNPVRCHRLYAALLQKESGSKRPPKQEKKPASLFEYLSGRGG